MNTSNKTISVPKAKLADLPAKWLATAEAARSAAVSASFTECADELESALSQQPSAAVPVEQEPVAWVAADTLNSPHPRCISSLAYMSQLDRERGREYVPLYAAHQQRAGVDEAAAIRAFEEHFQASSDDPYCEGELELWITAWRKALAQQQGGVA